MTNSQISSPLVAATGNRPRIYLACVASYNSGRLYGTWVEADQGEEHFWAALRAMIAGSPEPGAEEWAIHSYEGFEGAELSESASFEHVCALAEFIAEHGELGAKVYEYCGNDLDDARATFERYAGAYSSAAAFAEELHDDLGTQIPEGLQYYIDWQALAKDMDFSGDIILVELGFENVHVFWAR
ncbi:MAG: antirestriction protein ArdA [Pseudomonadota bacterium]